METEDRTSSVKPVLIPTPSQRKVLVSINHEVMDATEGRGSKEKETLNGILQRVGAQDLGKLRLRRDIKRQDYAYVTE